MKIRLMLYFLILVAGIYVFIFFTKPKWSPNYCSQFSGFNSYAWGHGSERCEKAGCMVQKTKEIDDLNIFDDEGFTYKCVKK